MVREFVVGNALAAVCIYPWLRLPKAERGWHPFGPLRGWRLVRAVSALALMIWAYYLGYLGWFVAAQKPSLIP